MTLAAIPYAVSVHGFIDKIGSYLAFAAIIGVALLVIMFFVQARETSLLRERAEDAEEDLERLREYAEQVARQSAAAAAAASRQATQPAQPPAQARAAAAAAAPPAARVAAPRPFAPVGVGAPALSSATRLIPLGEPAAVTATAPAAAATVTPSAATVTPSAATAAPAAATAAPAPSTVAAGGAAPPPVPPPSLGAAPRSAANGDTGPVGPPRARSAESSARAPRRDFGRAEEESRIGRGAVALAAVLVAVIVVAAVLVITHHSHHSTARRAAQATTTTRGSKGSRSRSGTTVTVNPGQVRVAVLNGTATNNLAADVSARLNKVGFQQGATANYADQTQTATTVGYLPGQRAQAMAVAKALGIKPGSVQQVSTTARQLVCPGTNTNCSDQVVVTVGANLDSDAS